MLGQHSSAGLPKAGVCTLPPLGLDLHKSEYLLGFGQLETQLQQLLRWKALEDNYSATAWDTLLRHLPSPRVSKAKIKPAIRNNPD